MNTKIIFSTLLFLSSMLLNAQTIMNIHQSNGAVLQIPTNTIDSITYSMPNPPNFATISTLPIVNVTPNPPVSGGFVTDDGGNLVTQRGIVWSTNTNPTTANNTTTNGGGTGIFQTDLTGLTPSTTYYVRAYAINSAGTSYGNQLSFTTYAGSGGIIITNPGAGVTFNGYNYSSIVLGNGQEWMAENLRTAVYANGDPIPSVTNAAQWLNLTTGAWVHYNFDSQYENPYGKLYNWYTVADPRNVCPTGWHVPTDAEYTALSDYLGGEPYAGGKMKSTGTQYWQSPNTSATNESGFSGLPGGCLSVNTTFNSIGLYSFLWSSTGAFGMATGLFLSYGGQNLISDNYYYELGASVRCLKD
jgi:uncharacterized protein (TIGR02145 family)